MREHITTRADTLLEMIFRSEPFDLGDENVNFTGGRTGLGAEHEGEKL